MRTLPGTVLHSVCNVFGGIDNNRIKPWNIPYYKHKSQFESWERLVEYCMLLLSKNIQIFRKYMYGMVFNWTLNEIENVLWNLF